MRIKKPGRLRICFRRIICICKKCVENLEEISQLCMIIVNPTQGGIEYSTLTLAMSDRETPIVTKIRERTLILCNINVIVINFISTDMDRGRAPIVMIVNPRVRIFRGQVLLKNAWFSPSFLLLNSTSLRSRHHHFRYFCILLYVVNPTYV